MNKYICIHGHYYQPPRENPWLEEIEFQDSAFPYGDWNERITAECYMPNTESRILGDKGLIVDIINNYSKMSFNFGPTLLSWMEKHDPEVYKGILAADIESQKNFSGHGAAIAQVYNHIIMPLASPRDKRTQIYWGIKDFEHRFKRKPEGMWLAETAVDIPTLEALVEHDIKFTILSPYQAKRVKKIEHGHWADVDCGVDPKRPYLCRLPSGKKIVLFFYDGPIAQEIAFGPLLKNGEGFANRLLGAFNPHHHHEQLVHIATDGETYGHHQKFANMALSYLFDHVERNNLANLTIYGEYLEKFPPTYEVEIVENSAWSCAHGVERWRSDCGCCIGSGHDWNQKWRTGLRNAMDWLRDELVEVYNGKMSRFTEDPWAVRNDFIHVMLDRSEANVESFFKNNFKSELSKNDKTAILRLLEMQRQSMFMYTSCGWFFDDVSGIESVQIIQYAARAIQIAKEISGKDLEKQYLDILSSAKSNIPKMHDGREIYQSIVKPSVIDLINVGAHYAISSLFETYPKSAKIYAYTIESEVYDKQKAGKQKIVVGKSVVRSEITWSEKLISFAVLHLGDYNLTVGVRDFTSDESFANMSKAIKSAFLESDITAVINLINENFNDNKFTLWDLFKNDQGKAMNRILEDSVDSIESHFRQIYDQYYPLMQSRKNLRIPLPKALAMTVEFVLNRDLIEVLESEELDVGQLQKICEEIRRWSFMRDKESVSLIAKEKIDRSMEKLLNEPNNAVLMGDIESVLRILKSLALDIDLWQAQNLYFYVGKELKHKMDSRASKQDQNAQFWLESYDKLGKYLRVAAS